MKERTLRFLPTVRVALAADVDADAEAELVEVAGDLTDRDMVVVWQAGKSNPAFGLPYGASSGRSNHPRPLHAETDLA